MRRITRALYHRAVRHIMRECDRMCTTKMAEAINENRTSASVVDGVVRDDEITQRTSDKYNHLYNSVSYDVDIHVKFQKCKCRRFMRKSEDLGDLCINQNISVYKRIVHKFEYFTSSATYKNYTRSALVPNILYMYYKLVH